MGDSPVAILYDSGGTEKGTVSNPVVVSGGATPASTATCTNVSASASSVQLLAANSSRLGVTVYNDSMAVLYLKLGTTASATSFTVRLARYDYYEVPGRYTGCIDGIWTVATGAARVTELT